MSDHQWVEVAACIDQNKSRGGSDRIFIVGACLTPSVLSSKLWFEADLEVQKAEPPGIGRDSHSEVLADVMPACSSP